MARALCSCALAAFVSVCGDALAAHASRCRILAARVSASGARLLAALTRAASARAVVGCALAVLSAGGSFASAQDAGTQDTGAGVRVVRPPEGSLRRGVLAAPEWVVHAGGGALALGAGGALVWRLAKRRR